MALSKTPFSDFPEFSDSAIELKRSSGQFDEYAIVDNLLQDKNGLLLAGVEQRVNVRMDTIKSGFDRKEWPAQVREAVKQLERDAVRDQDSTADTTEDRVSKRRREVLEQIKGNIRTQLYAYLDNKEFGGLEYVLSLVEQIKDKLESPGTGILNALNTNAERYREIKEAVRTREYERLLSNLEQTRGGLFGGGEKQAVTVMDHLRTEIANALKFHLRAKAADEAVALMTELSAWLGKRTGVDAHGRAHWNGLVGEFQAGREAVLAMLAQLQHSNAVLQQDLRKDHATLIAIQVNQPEVALPGSAQLREWADDAFKDLGGSRALFPMLGEPAQRAEILLKVKRMAERQLALASATDGDAAASDPLFDALEQMNPAERMDKFRKLLACSMPWIDANLAGDFTVKADQFKCFIGVAGADKFKAKFGDELGAGIPTHAGITAAQLEIVETGVPGRAVCYCELSGIPMTVLRGMPGWRTSYRKEAEKNPTHTHIDATQFSHPMAPSTEEIGRLAEDFKYYLLAVMLGVLTRSTQRIVPRGQYQFAVARGDVRRIGNERAVRQNGLPSTYRAAIVSRVQDRLAECDAEQTAALAALAHFYETAVYTPKLVEDATGAQESRKGFASAISSEVMHELRDKARRKGMGERELDQLDERLQNGLKDWAVVVPDSDEDAYDYEVREPGDDGLPRLKYAMRPEMLEAGGMAALLTRSAAAGAAVTPGAASLPGLAPAMPGMPPPMPGMPPPLGGMPPPLVEHQYHLGVGGQQYGPFGAMQVVQMVQSGQVSVAGTKVWRVGLTAWGELGQLPELAMLLQAPAAPMMPPPLV